MNIWILTSETPHHWAGGIARYVDHFARLAGAAGHELTVISRGPETRRREIAPGYRMIEFRDRFEDGKLPMGDIEPDAHPGWPFNNMAYFPSLSFQYAQELDSILADEGAPDVIECQDYAALGYFILQRKHTEPGYLRDIPVVIHLHTPDFAVQLLNQYPRYKLPDYWTGRMERGAIWMADALLSPSRFIARELPAFMEGGLPEVTTIPYPWPQLHPEGLGRPGKDRTVFFPGRYELRKGIEPLLATCEALWLAGIDFTLEMAGGDVHTPLKGGSMKAFLAKKYAHRIASGHLILGEAVPHDEVLEKMRQASVVVIPSLWENFPNTCIEAMALGKVALVSEEGGQAEMLGSGTANGFRFSHAREGSFAEALQAALALDSAEREAIGKRAHARIVSLCHPETVLEQRMAHFQRVIDAHQPRSDFPFPNKRLREGTVAVALKEEPLLSVIIPYYNLGAYLDEAVSSVLVSREVHLEVLIINDGSTEEASLKALDAWRSHTDQRVRVLDFPNGGLARTRNRGAEAAKGDLLAFVDADDRVTPDFFRRAIGVLQRYRNVHLAYSWVRFFDGSRGIWHAWNFDLPYLLCHNQLVPLVVVRKDTFLKYGQNKSHIIYGLEDFESWISLAEAGCGGVAIPEPLAGYRIRPDSMFKVIQPDKKLYLYDLIASEHPDLYKAYGEEIFHLPNATGPAHAWSQPTMFDAPQERLLNALERAESSLATVHDLEEQNRRLREAEIWLQGERRRLAKLAGETLDPP